MNTEEKEKLWSDAYFNSTSKIMSGLASFGDYLYVQNYEDWMRFHKGPSWETVTF
jgi:hypothetical protein